MFYCINPNHRYQFFSPSRSDGLDPFFPPRPTPTPPGPTPTDDQPTEKPKRNLVNALTALYEAYGGTKKLNNNAVDIIYKIANVINERNNPAEEAVHGPELKD